MHGSFSRADSMNLMAAIGPDFKAAYIDALPVGNADVGMTIAQLIDLHPANEGGLIGRVMSEALPNGMTPKAVAGTFVSKPAANGLKTVVKYQRVLAQRYFHAPDIAGRTVGLDAQGGKQKTAGDPPPTPVKGGGAAGETNPTSDSARGWAPGRAGAPP